MPRAFRQCRFCSNNTNLNPGILHFTVTDHIKSCLNITFPSACFICEEHFEIEDFKVHGDSRRLKDTAVPVHFPRRKSVSHDHNYILTGPLNLVSSFIETTGN